jgi:hypothetical protein
VARCDITFYRLALGPDLIGVDCFVKIGANINWVLHYTKQQIDSIYIYIHRKHMRYFFYRWNMCRHLHQRGYARTAKSQSIHEYKVTKSYTQVMSNDMWEMTEPERVIAIDCSYWKDDYSVRCAVDCWATVVPVYLVPSQWVCMLCTDPGWPHPTILLPPQVSTEYYSLPTVVCTRVAYPPWPWTDTHTTI